MNSCSVSSIGSQKGSYKKLTIEGLLEQNKMKDVALQKATKLITLLTSELQASKTEKEQLEKSIRDSYESRIEEMFDRMQLLEYQLEKVEKVNNSVQNVEASNQLKLPSTNNLFMQSQENLSPTIRKNRSINRAYSKEDSICSKQTEKGLNVDQEMFREYLVQNQEWKNDVIDSICQLVSEQNRQLVEMKRSNKESRSELAGTFEPLPQCLLDQKINKLLKIIEEQEGLILSLKQYIEKVQQNYLAYFSKLEQSSHKKYSVEPVSFMVVDEALLQVKLNLMKQKRDWNGARSDLLVENMELKSIAEKMINLYKAQRNDSTQLLF